MSEATRVGVRLACALFPALIVAGCLVGPDFRPPQTELPSAWVGLTHAPGAQPSVATDAPADLSEWWRTFDDPKLTTLIQGALRANLDVQMAEARLRQARAERGIAAGAAWPTVDASVSGQRQHQAATSLAPARAGNVYQAGLDAGWELDIFGGARRSIESAEAGIQAAQDDLRDVQVSLAAEVALDYVQLRGFQQQIVIAQRNLEAQQKTADITRERFAAGFVGALDVANADALVATTQSQVPVLETSARQAIYALSVLLARPPADLVQELSETEPLPTTPPEVPAGVPSDLLRRRPDIRRAEAQLHAATAQIGVATADLFPRFSLTGTVGWMGDLLHGWFTTANRSWTLGPSAEETLFQRGKVSAVRVQEALRDQSFLDYRKTVLGALQDVEDSLVSFSKEWEHRKALADAVAANRKAVSLATELYTEGQTDFISVLDAQRSFFTSEDAFVQSTRSTATDLIALYKALGGGWDARTGAGSPPPDERRTAHETDVESTRTCGNPDLHADAGRAGDINGLCAGAASGSTSSATE
jgi:NodT family efflux transporter outer membrane factor (OMF) lipoprotein